ncbi:MAG: SDR family oxidoreductase [Phycisphaerae bacterium]
MKVLYIGGTGEISYECVRASAAAGQDVTVFNRGRTVGEPLPEGVRRVTGELNDPTYRGLARERFDVVCQFLAYEPAQIEADLEVFGGNVGQYLFISTASAYEKPGTRWRITEDVPLSNPFWAYSQTKADMERTLFRWHAEGRLPVTVVRPSHTYRRKFPGTFVPGDDHVWRMLNGRPVVIHGDGTGLWTWTHASDFARPFVRLLGNPKAIGEAFHITRPDAFTWNEIFAAIAEALGVTPTVVYVPSRTIVKYDAEWVGPLLGDKACPVEFDLKKLKSVVGEFECAVGARAGAASVVPHYRERAKAYVPAEKLHALIDRITREQEGLGA